MSSFFRASSLWAVFFLVFVATGSACTFGDNTPATADPTVPPPTPENCPAYEAPAYAKTCTGTTIEEKLGCIPGLTFELDPDDFLDIEGYTRIRLSLELPIDHNNPAAGTFVQHAMMWHKDFESPMTFAGGGYYLFGYYPAEIAFVYGTNAFEFEHRFFGNSVPSPLDWKKLNIEQQARDEHEWVTALKWIYPQPWVNTGASKGGETAVYHRKYFNCDFAGTVAYVAPFTPQIADPRYGEFLQNVGGETYAQCRDDLLALQREALSRRNAMTSRLNPADFTRFGVDRAFEHGVIEFPWAFWQYGNPLDEDDGCAQIPSIEASDDEIFNFMDKAIGFADLNSDSTLAAFGPYYYQAATEQGDYLPPEQGLEDLLVYPGTDTAAFYSPIGSDPIYDGTEMAETLDFVATKATDIIFIYGSLDPWTAGAIPDPTHDKILKLTAPGANHGAGLFDLADQDRSAAIAMLSKWFGRQPSSSLRSTGQRIPRLSAREQRDLMRAQSAKYSH